MLLLFGPYAGRGADVSAAKESQLKAAFIFNFTKFVEWPLKSFPSGSSPIVIGIVGKGPIGSEIEQMVKGRKVIG